MSQPPLARVEDLFHRAAGLRPAERSAFLDEQCADDAGLRGAVEELLRQDDGGSPTVPLLVSPIVRQAEVNTPGAETTRDTVRPGAPAADAIPGYELLGEIGRGGMGVVYKARQAGLDRLVALKMLLSGSAVGGEQLARFRAEAAALARLQHPNIVQVFEVGEYQGRPYFSMEYVPGGSLSQQLRGMPQPAAVTARLIEVLARTMHAVHRQGILHRDLKPANILMQGEDTRTGNHDASADGGAQPREDREDVRFLHPKVTDFGIAKDQKAERSFTHAGQPIGTPCYMAPEQARGETAALGPAADVYALGAILYEMLTARPPLEAASAAETVALVLAEEPVPPGRLVPGLPRDLETICLKCLQKEPGKRYASALDLAEDLRLFQAGEPIKARPVGRLEAAWRWCRRRPVVAGLLGTVAAMAVTLIVTVLVYNAKLEHALAQAQQKVEDERRQLVRLDVTLGLGSLDDGYDLTALLWFAEALHLDEGHLKQEWKHRTRIAAVLRQCPRLIGLLVPGKPVLDARLTAKGCRVATAGADGVVQVWDVTAGTPFGRGLRHGTAVRCAAFDADGRRLATATSDGQLQVWDLTTNRPALPAFPVGGTAKEIVFPPGGKVVLIRFADNRVRLWDLTTREPVPLQGFPDGAVQFSMESDDARWVFAVVDQKTGRVWDTATGRASAAALESGQEVKHGAFSANGRHLALVGADKAVRVWDVSTGRPVGGPFRHPAPVAQVSLSPVGDRIVTACEDHLARVWMVDAGRAPFPPLRHESAVDHARFSPDGRLLVTCARHTRVGVWDAATGEPVTPPLNHNDRIREAAFSPDSRRFLLVGEDGTVRLWELARPFEKVVGNVPGVELAERVFPSPDGRRVIKLGAGPTVQVTDAATGAPVGAPLRHGGPVRRVAFSDDGRHVATASDDNTARVWSAETGEPLTPPLQHKDRVLDVAFSPFGGRVVTASADRTARVWDAETGDPLGPPLKHPGAVVQAAFSPASDFAVTVCGDGLVRAWDVRPTDLPVAAIMRLARVMASSRLDAQAGVVALNAEDLAAAWRPAQVGEAVGR
jgi:WD40 repeat protein/serine/threonine protein kinase